MTLLTIFTAPKPFQDLHISLIQRNAIHSWTQLGPDVEVILMGRDSGVAETAAELGVSHLPQVACNEKGVPYIGDMFRLARDHSEAPLLMVINTDIIVFPDLLQAARDAHRQFEAFVLAGQRWDLDVTGPLDFSAGWENRLRAEIRLRGHLHRPSGSDYFLFPREVFQDVPNFTIGRAGWDNWMIYQAVTQPWNALDATPAVTIVHQNHDYHHLPGGQIHYQHPESKQNVAIGGGSQKMYYLWDIPFIFAGGEMRRKPLTWLQAVRTLERRVQPEEAGDTFHWKLFVKLRRYRKRLEKAYDRRLGLKTDG